MTIFSKDELKQEFWSWFTQNESRLYEFEKDQEIILDELSEHLSKYREGVTFELSSVSDGKREFVISADGVEELFPAVIELKKSCPDLVRWSVIAFRQRMNNYMSFKLEYGGKEFDPEKLWIYYRVKDGHFDLILYYPDYNEKERKLFVSGTYILLDTALGEYDVTTGIRFIDHQKLPENPKEKGLLPFSDLRKVFDGYKNYDIAIN